MPFSVHKANGDVLDGPSREVFLQPPDPQRLHEAVVEMQFPLRRSGPVDS